MKILEIIPQLSSGGAERFVVDLSNELSEKHNISLLTYYAIETNGFYAKDLSSAINVITMNKRKGFSLSLSFKLFSIIVRMKPDVVHMHLTAISYLLLSVFFYRKCKYFMTIHSAADKEAGGKIGSYLRKLCFKNNKIIPITISDESKKSFIEFYGIDAPMIFNGRDIPKNIKITEDVVREFQKYKKTLSTKVIVNLARINVVKRQPLLAKVAKRLYDEGYDFSVLMIGNNKNQNLVTEIQACDCPIVYILGERHNPLEYLSLADAYCLCSSYEGMPISLIEALGIGCIPICTPVGGIKDVVKDGINGLLTDDLSEDSLYFALKRFLELPDCDVDRLKTNAKFSYEPFSMKTCAEKYVQLFIS